MKRQLANQTLNIFWTGLCFTPVVWYWSKQALDIWGYIFLTIAVLVAFLPQKIIGNLHFFQHRRQYEKWGAKFIQWFTQDGRWAGQFNKSNRVIKNVRQATQYLTTISMYERFHWMCFVFFLLSSLHAFTQGIILLGFLMFFANIPYNVASLLLQQYNRLRIMKFAK
jgi:hypothetical protein